jgi:hypothetical protein
MLHTLTDAKTYAINKVSEITGEEISLEEKSLIELNIEEMFFDKLSQLVSEEELEKANATTLEELEGRLFYHLPNYVTLLEETTAEFMADYLLDDEVDEKGEEFDVEEKTEEPPMSVS